MPRKTFTLVVGSDDGVPLELLAQQVENILTGFRAMESQVEPGGIPLRWEIIRATMSSPLTLTIAPMPPSADKTTSRKDRLKIEKKASQRAEKVIVGYIKGVKQIERKAVAPKWFTEKALVATKELMSSGHVEISVPKQGKVTSSPKMVENIQRIIGPSTMSFREYGTLEGTLELVSTHGRDHVCIWDSLTGARIDCFVTADQLEQATAILRSRRNRVEITGDIKYTHGKPVTVDVESIRPLRSQDELPQPKDVGRIKLPAGLSSEAYIRELRDAH